MDARLKADYVTQATLARMRVHQLETQVRTLVEGVKVWRMLALVGWGAAVIMVLAGVGLEVARVCWR
jgi:hypothetical protein